MKNIRKFSEIPIDRNEIEQEILNITDKVRSNLFAWNGQFSPQFVEALLTKYAKQDYFVIDPFVGSGTVLAECARKGLKSYGIELNISAYCMAKTYEIATIDINKRNDIVERIESLFKRIDKDENIVRLITEEISSNPETMYSNLLATTIILMDIFYNEITSDLLWKKWEIVKKAINEIPFSTNEVRADRGDSRKLNIGDSCADLLITSPPYINVFNYHQKYRRSVEALGYNVLSIAKTEFGSNRKNRGNRFLTIIQYCIDMALSIQESIRVCKENSRMIYVVGRESSVLGYSFCNSELIYNIGTRIFSLDFIIRQERVFKNRFGQMIYEDIIHFKNKKCDVSKDKIIEEARNIAVEIMQHKIDFDEENKNTSLLALAIERANTIIPSEGIA